LRGRSGSAYDKYAFFHEILYESGDYVYVALEAANVLEITSSHRSDVAHVQAVDRSWAP